MKEKLYMFLVHIINQENDLPVQGYQQSSTSSVAECYYKYSIGPGNNSLMVRNIMKQRWWWYLHSNEKKGSTSFDEINFIWTQWRRNKISQQLKTIKHYNNCQDDTSNLAGNEELQTNAGSSSLNSSFNVASPLNRNSSLVQTVQ